MDFVYQDPIARFRDILQEVSAGPHIERVAPLTPLSPISRFPTELKSYVFYFCLPLERETCLPCSILGFSECLDHSFYDYHAPLLLMQVSKEWRCIA